jgi:hypothetical protein
MGDVLLNEFLTLPGFLWDNPARRKTGIPKKFRKQRFFFFGNGAMSGFGPLGGLGGNLSIFERASSPLPWSST